MFQDPLPILALHLAMRKFEPKILTQKGTKRGQQPHIVIPLAREDDMNPKTFYVIVVLVLASVSSLYSQEWLHNDELLMDVLALDAGKVAEFRTIFQENRLEIRYATADRRIYEAQIERLLLDPKPDMTAIERHLRAILDIELAARMYEIRRNVAIREYLGEDRWRRFEVFLREAQLHEEEMRRFEREHIAPTLPPEVVDGILEMTNFIREFRERTINTR